MSVKKEEMLDMKDKFLRMLKNLTVVVEKEFELKVLLTNIEEFEGNNFLCVTDEMDTLVHMNDLVKEKLCKKLKQGKFHISCERLKGRNLYYFDFIF